MSVQLYNPNTLHEGREALFHEIRRNPARINDFVSLFLERSAEIDRKFENPNSTFYYNKDTFKIENAPGKICNISEEGNEFKKNVQRHYALRFPSSIERNIKADLLIHNFLIYKSEKGWDKFANLFRKIQADAFISNDAKNRKQLTPFEIATQNTALFDSVLSAIDVTTSRVADHKNAILATIHKLQTNSKISEQEKKQLITFHITNFNVINISSDDISNFDKHFKKLQKKLKQPIVRSSFLTAIQSALNKLGQQILRLNQQILRFNQQVRRLSQQIHNWTMAFFDPFYIAPIDISRARRHITPAPPNFINLRR